VIWLKNGITGDDTHAHVDISPLVNETTVLTIVEENSRVRELSPSSGKSAILKQSKKSRRLASARRRTSHACAGLFQRARLPASYANFYVANKLVLVPVFRYPTTASR